MASKINQILTEWVPGDVHSLRWFYERGIAQNHAYEYFKSGTLEKLGPGIYSRKHEKLKWFGGVRLLQEELQKKIHVSGRTALELHGHSHHVSLGKRPLVFLTSYDKYQVPEWFTKIDFSCEFKFKKSVLFTSPVELVKHEFETGLSVWISSRELAVLEFINELDLRYSFETAENYMSGLLGLRAEILQSLLENCSSVKVKRVFLFLAEKLNYDYLKKLDVSKFNLGKGKRQVILENGQLNQKYQITVPKEYGENPF
jgi:hypothetical protein